MARFVVLVIDSFGVGAMKDVTLVRPQDAGANTCGHSSASCRICSYQRWRSWG